MMRSCFIFVLVILLTSSLYSSEMAGSESPAKVNSLGLGLGIPYGVFGLNYDHNIARNFNLSIGIGTTAIAGMGYSIGGKYFFAPAEKSFRPRVSAYYGVNAMVLKEGIGEDDEGESYTGITIGAGGQWLWGETKTHGMDFDIMFIATTTYDVDELKAEGYEVTEDSGIKISIGYRRAF